MLIEQKTKRFRSSLAQQIRVMLGRAGALVELNARIRGIEHRMQRLEYFSYGSRATYVGNNRLLAQIVVENYNIAYYLEADDRLLTPWIVVSGGYETDLTKYFVRELRSDSHCIDIGSNFGYFTCLMARFCPDGQVIGIEADQRIAELARDNTFINGFQHAHVLHAAVGDSDADVTLYRRNTRSGNTSITKVNDDLTTFLGEPSAEPFMVRGIRVDDLMPRMNDRVDFMKVDVEGAEPLIFQGAHRTIAANPNLKIVMEWSPGQIRDAGFKIPTFLRSLSELGLQPFDITEGALVPLSFDELLNLPYRAGIVLQKTV